VWNACRHSSFAVQTPALRTIGDIVTGDDTHAQVVLDLSILRVLPSLLTSARKNIRKDACWMLSNITARDTPHIQAVIDANLFPQLVTLLGETDLDVAFQAARAIANAISSGSPEQIQYLVKQGHCVSPFCALLGCGNDKIIAVVLEALDNILSEVERVSASGSAFNHRATSIIGLGVVDEVVQLQAHSDDDIRNKAIRLLGVFVPSGVSTNSTSLPSLQATSQQASSNVFSFSTFHAALP
jgi:hypothetical protein